MPTRTLVTGAGGFIGHHLVSFLKAKGHWVKGVDIKAPEYASTQADAFEFLDLRRWESCLAATKGVDEVYNLAADMGGIGFISGNHAQVAHNNVLINTHMLEASRQNDVNRLLYSSSACVYPAYRQKDAAVTALREEDAYPAEPEEGYGWEKLFTEKLCQYYGEDYGLETRIVRFHNVYGPLGTYDGGREKAPAAICRKVALAHDGDTIEIWGDGLQTRSFMYIDDCLEGVHRLMQSSHRDPLNLGTEELVTVDELVDAACHAAGKTLKKQHLLDKPQGVRGRNSDNTRLRQTLGWEPPTRLEQGLGATYHWIEGQLRGSGRLAPVR